MVRIISAELIGTFLLVFAGGGAAMAAAAQPEMGFGMLGVAFVSGLMFLLLYHLLAPLSGCHLNPAVSVGLWAAGRFNARALPAYIMAQTLGAIAAASGLVALTSIYPEFDIELAANGVANASPEHFGYFAGAFTEVVMTFMLVFVLLGISGCKATRSYTPVALALTLALVHLISMPITNTSVNPARSTGPALLAGGVYVAQLWVFWIAPLVGALAAGWVSQRIEKMTPWQFARPRPRAGSPMNPPAVTTERAVTRHPKPALALLPARSSSS